MKEANVKVEARHIENGNWIIANIHGEYRMGKVFEIARHNGGWLELRCENDGAKFNCNPHANDLITLCCYVATEEEAGDRLIEIILRRGRPLCVVHCTADVEALKTNGDFKFRSRDGRYFFKDGSFIRVNDDGTRTLIDGKGKECEWPVNRRKRT